MYFCSVHIVFYILINCNIKLRSLIFPENNQAIGNTGLIYSPGNRQETVKGGGPFYLFLFNEVSLAYNIILVSGIHHNDMIYVYIAK